MPGSTALSMIKAAKNVDQVYAFLELPADAGSHRPQWPKARATTRSSPVPMRLLSDAAKKNFQEAYPGDALKKLWHRPPEPSWFGELRTQYADKFKSA